MGWNTPVTPHPGQQSRDTDVLVSPCWGAAPGTPAPARGESPFLGHGQAALLLAAGPERPLKAPSQQNSFLKPWEEALLRGTGDTRHKRSVAEAASA